MADQADLERLTRELTDEGKLIEAGWMGYRIGAMPPNAPPIQYAECKMAFFAGAYHLFTGIMTIMDHDKEPTESDYKKMDMIHRELAEFAETLELRLNKKGSA